ncbi:MAG: glycine cleavage system aminomethyltransferase GcvT [Candidatus Bruticola sp.]
MANELLRTPLYEAHKRDGGKIVEFAGWEMPVEYTGIKSEHLAVRSEVGIFDLTHMGEFEITGPDATEFIDSLVTNDVRRMTEGQCMYTCMCRENGCIIDDLIVYRFPNTAEGIPYYWLIVNAANCAKDYQWVESHLQGQVELKNISMETALIAVQGPKAQAVLQPFTSTDLGPLAYYHLTRGDFQGLNVVISRTGYTGEDGFEIYVPWHDAEKVWNALRSEGCLPIGLGARDTLRLEAGYSLYGHEITEATTPINTSLGWVVRFTEHNFIGKDILLAQKEKGAETAIIGLVMKGRSIPRQGHAVENSQGQVVGSVTSGTFSPSLGRGVCLALVENGCRKDTNEFNIRVRPNRSEPAVVQRPPFVRGSVRR